MENKSGSAVPSQMTKMEVSFFNPDEKFTFEKPYGFKFPPDDQQLRRSNIEQRRHTCEVVNMRGMEKAFTIERNGFTVFDLGDTLDLSYLEYHDDEHVQRYFRLLEAQLKENLGAEEVKVFRWGIRKRHPHWPVPALTTYIHDQPTTAAHVDATTNEAAREIRYQEGVHADQLLMKRFQWINFWKPLKGPLNDWPLLVCDAATVDKTADITESDLIYHDHVAENMQVYYRPYYRWYYLGDQKTNEVLVFKQADSLESSVAGVPHCSAYNPLAPSDESPRESIEARALVYYSS